MFAHLKGQHEASLRQTHQHVGQNMEAGGAHTHLALHTNTEVLVSIKTAAGNFLYMIFRVLPSRLQRQRRIRRKLEPAEVGTEAESRRIT